MASQRALLLVGEGFKVLLNLQTDDARRRRSLWKISAGRVSKSWENLWRAEMDETRMRSRDGRCSAASSGEEPHKPQTEELLYRGASWLDFLLTPLLLATRPVEIIAQSVNNLVCHGEHIHLPKQAWRQATTGNTGTFVNETTDLFTKLQPIEKEGQAMETLETFLQFRVFDITQVWDLACSYLVESPCHPHGASQGANHQLEVNFNTNTIGWMIERTDLYFLRDTETFTSFARISQFCSRLNLRMALSIVRHSTWRQTTDTPVHRWRSDADSSRTPLQSAPDLSFYAYFKSQWIPSPLASCNAHVLVVACASFKTWFSLSYLTFIIMFSHETPEVNAPPTRNRNIKSLSHRLVDKLGEFPLSRTCKAAACGREAPLRYRYTRYLMQHLDQAIRKDVAHVASVEEVCRLGREEEPTVLDRGMFGPFTLALSALETNDGRSPGNIPRAAVAWTSSIIRVSLFFSQLLQYQREYPCLCLRPRPGPHRERSAWTAMSYMGLYRAALIASLPHRLSGYDRSPMTILLTKLGNGCITPVRMNVMFNLIIEPNRRDLLIPYQRNMAVTKLVIDSPAIDEMGGGHTDAAPCLYAFLSELRSKAEPIVDGDKRSRCIYRNIKADVPMSAVLIRIGTWKKNFWKGPILVRSRVASSDRWVGFTVVGPLWAWRRRLGGAKKKAGKIGWDSNDKTSTRADCWQCTTAGPSGSEQRDSVGCVGRKRTEEREKRVSGCSQCDEGRGNCFQTPNRKPHFPKFNGWAKDSSRHPRPKLQPSRNLKEHLRRQRSMQTAPHDPYGLGWHGWEENVLPPGGHFPRIAKCRPALPRLAVCYYSYLQGIDIVLSGSNRTNTMKAGMIAKRTLLHFPPSITSWSSEKRTITSKHAGIWLLDERCSELPIPITVGRCTVQGLPTSEAEKDQRVTSYSPQVKACCLLPVIGYFPPTEAGNLVEGLISFFPLLSIFRLFLRVE
ncbi:hypothetical protein CCUS01_05179 [Colletotrichum cuscutae]|uniref:Uncharacterized protein n=1 Tax=Colletotrichum cuscutae TaxID=1209917 RepID=A0AAI9V7X8_9PEZI|nr:hypothetical protein CCUS01_05179 [Colletotrichum cuscutae]